MFCEQFFISVLHSSRRKHLFLKFEQNLPISYRIKNITIIIIVTKYEYFFICEFTVRRDKPDI